MNRALPPETFFLAPTISADDLSLLRIPRTIGATTADLDRLASNADTGLEAAIPLPNVSSKILQKVIDYCKHHSEKKEGEADEDKNFDAEFVKVDQATLFELILVRCDPEPAPRITPKTRKF